MDVVDVEEDLVLSSVFKDYFQDSYQDNPEFLVYLSELSSYGIAKLNSEPQRLAEEKAQILEETRSLAFHNYKTFIQTAECCKEIFQDFQIIEKRVDSMLLRLPNLMTSCGNFLQQAHDINSSRKVNNLTLLKYAQLLEFLELPQLVDTCVRNEYYEETLELAEYVKRLEKKHSNIPIVQKIVDEVKLNMQQMLLQLLQQLRSNVQLPACLRILGYLRRMNIFTETQLRIKFLQTRDSWFQSVLNAIPKDDAYHHINKTIEASRVHLFDIITQYRAIFTDDDSIYSPSSSSSSSSFLKDHHHLYTDRQVNDAVLFHSWVLQKISSFLSTLEDDLYRGGCGGYHNSRTNNSINSYNNSGYIDSSNNNIVGRLDSLMAQCMYFGLSFSRVGVDFRGLVVPIFERATYGLFENAIQVANNGLKSSLQSYSLLGSQPTAPSTFHHMPSSSSSSSLSIPHPPPRLLHHTPLATFTNDVLMAFNDLRLCVPYTLISRVTNCLNTSLVRAVECIVAFHKMDETTLTKQETDRFVDLCCCFVDDLIPHFNKCLQHLFNPNLVNALLGFNVAENIAKEEGLGELNIEKIVGPLKRFLPVPQVVTSAPAITSSTMDATTTTATTINVSATALLTTASTVTSTTTTSPETTTTTTSLGTTTTTTSPETTTTSSTSEIPPPTSTIPPITTTITNIPTTTTTITNATDTSTTTIPFTTDSTSTTITTTTASITTTTTPATTTIASITTTATSTPTIVTTNTPTTTTTTKDTLEINHSIEGVMNGIDNEIKSNDDEKNDDDKVVDNQLMKISKDDGSNEFGDNVDANVDNVAMDDGDVDVKKINNMKNNNYINDDNDGDNNNVIEADHK